APLYERRTGPRKLALEPALAPASQWNPMLPGLAVGPARNRFVRSRATNGKPLGSDSDIAFAPVSQLSRWIESRQLTAERLARIYLERLERFQPKINCTITLTRELALAQAKQADAEIAAGKYRGPLHGIPWGAKVLVDKLSLGALALNDIWYGGQTNNPWLPEEGASGSSAGPGAATAAACVGFSIGS